MRRLHSSWRARLAGIAMAGVVVVMATAPAHADKPNPPVEPPGQSVSGDARTEARPEPPGLSRARAAIERRLAAHVQRRAPGESFGLYSDTRRGKVILETNAPAAAVAEVVGTDAAMVEVRSQAVTDYFSRRDDISPYWGGAGIRTASSICSAGYAVRNGAGTRFMVTAGHCAPNGATETTELNGRVFGTVSGNGLPSKDMELLGGQSYGSAIYGGGVDSASGYHVAGAGDPVVGFANYCHSGRTTGENCGHTAVSTTATVCTTSGCKFPVTAFQGGVLPQGGDSGAPFFVGGGGTDKHIRGHVIAGNGTTSYAELWSNVAAKYGVTIVT
jgi:hypothetical protein